MARELIEAGWPKARALVGGWTAWQAAGLRVQAVADAVGQGEAYVTEHDSD